MGKRAARPRIIRRWLLETCQWRGMLVSLRALSREQALIIELFYFDEAPHSEIARRLALPLGTVKSRLRLAVQRLRAELEDLG